MVDAQTLKQQCTGKWLGIFSNLGIDVGDGKHGPCPACGGRDRFRLDLKERDVGGYYCNQCGAGFGIDLVQKSLGLTFPEALHRISEIVGTVEPNTDANKPKTDPRDMLNKIWKSSIPLDGKDLTTQYLRSRKLVLTPHDIRHCPACYNSDTKSNMPAMIAMVRNKDGKPVALHRTYLDGPKKADVKSSKKLTPATERLAGSAIRLYNYSDVLGVAEGIETSIAATQLFEIPTWATMSTSLMEAWEPPEGVRKIVIFGDCDSNFAGQSAVYRLAKKLYNKDLIVDIQIPVIGDWADEVERIAN